MNINTNTFLTLIFTPIGIGLSGMVVWFLRRRLRLWEWAQQERRKKDKEFDCLKNAYRILYERHQDDKLHLDEMQKREEKGDVMWRYFMMDLSMRPLLPNILERIENESDRRNEWVSTEIQSGSMEE